MRRTRDLKIVAGLCAGAVVALTAQPSEHVHAAGADEHEAVVHRHVDESSSHPFDPSLEHPNHHESAWFLDPVFTKAAKFKVDRPAVEVRPSLARPEGEFEGHVDVPDPRPNRGAPRHPDMARGPPLDITSAH